MKNRAVRIALLLLAVLAFAGAGYQLVLVENQAVAAREAADAFQQKVQRLAVAVRELRAAQYAYVASGQASDFWTARASALLSAMAAELPALCAAVATDSAARQASAGCAEAQNDLASIERIDASVRAYVRDAQVAAAADLVFGNLREANQALAAHLEDVRIGQAAADAQAASARRTRQLATIGGAAVFALLILLLLTPGGRSRAAAETESSGSRANAQSPLITLSPRADRIDGPLVDPHAADDESASAGSPEKPANVTTERNPMQADTAVRRPAHANAVGAADLGQAAGLCTDFAQLQEPADLPALLGRLATLLDAAGIVVWVEDPACGELRPALSHGYPPHALARMRGLSKDDDNATAIAFRDRVLRVVPGDASSNGAIAVPLLAPGSCVGVMAAEIRGGRERDRSTQALATIVAAQLATLVHPQAALPESSDPDFRLQLDN